MKHHHGRKDDPNAHLKVYYALEHLAKALHLLKGAGALKAAEKVRRARKSTEGAYRHAWRMAPSTTVWQPHARLPEEARP